MLVVISDLHLGDGTTAGPSQPVRFICLPNVYARMHTSPPYGRVSTARSRNWMLSCWGISSTRCTLRNGCSRRKAREEYDTIDGQKLARITEQGDKDYIRPWSDTDDTRFAAKLLGSDTRHS